MVMDIVYGMEIHQANDKYFKMVERMAEAGEAILAPGKFLVEAFPAMLYIPSWCPGGGFKKFAAEAKRDIFYILDSLFTSARDVMVSSNVSCHLISAIFMFLLAREARESLGHQPHIKGLKARK